VSEYDDYVQCNDNIKEHDLRRPGLPNALVAMEHGNNRTEKSTAMALSI
jgi:hypothetical protein